MTAPTTTEIEQAFADELGGETVAAYVIGQGYGGRAAVVATPTRVVVLKVAMFKLKARGVVDSIPLAEAHVKRSGLRFAVDKHSVKLGLADNARAQALADHVARHAA